MLDVHNYTHCMQIIIPAQKIHFHHHSPSHKKELKVAALKLGVAVAKNYI